MKKWKQSSKHNSVKIMNQIVDYFIPENRAKQGGGNICITHSKFVNIQADGLPHIYQSWVTVIISLHFTQYFIS